MNNYIRISCDLSPGEISATTKRGAAFIENCKLFNIPTAEGNVPHFAVLGSGGGLRAMVALLGTLHELCDQKLMDFFMYLCGVSGSTWCMSSVYNYAFDWPVNMDDVESKICAQLLQNKTFTKEGLKYAEDAAHGEQYSLTDFWAYFQISNSLQKIDQSLLSIHQCDSACSAPYPIFAAIDQKKFDEPDGANNLGAWFEFTIHEAGYPEPGAFIDITHLGSQFGNGAVVKEEPEKILCYLNGLWGSAPGSWKFIKQVIKDYIWHLIFGDAETHNLSTTDFITIDNLKHIYDLILDINLNVACQPDSKCYLHTLKQFLIEQGNTNSDTYKTTLEMYETWNTSSTNTKEDQFKQLFINFISDFRGISHMEMKKKIKFWDFIKKNIKCFFNWQWGTCHNFLYDFGSVQIPTEHTVDRFISLIDAGLAINVAYPLILRKERRVKLLLSFDFSEGDPFLTLIQAKEYCSMNKIPFPEIDEEKLEKEKDEPSDCYVFEGSGTVPTVMHFVLFNKVNCKGEIKYWKDRYNTFKRSYTEEDIDLLLQKAKQNVINNKEKIVQIIKSNIETS